MSTRRSSSSLVLICCAVLAVMVLSYFYTNAQSYQPWVQGNVVEGEPSVVGKVDDDDDETAEDEEIQKEESLAGPECTSKRLRHPGMNRGMKLQFVHLPKTGGSSVQMAINDWVEDNLRISLGILNVPQVQGSSYKCPIRAMERTVLIGHRGWGFCEDIEHYKGGLFTITAVRDAVSRMVSLYDYNLLKRATEKAHRLFGDPSTATRYTLRDLIKQYNATTNIIEPGEAILRYSGSQQTRFMCGYECLGPNAFKNDTFTDEFMLERALMNLRKTDCVGVTDHLDGLLDQMRLHIKWVPSRFTSWRRQNIVPSSMKSIIDEEAEAILAKWGWTDQRLYEEASIIAHEKTKLARKCLAKMKG